MIKLNILPGKTFTKKEFLQLSPYSIALDGIVNSPTFRLSNHKGPWANFDHHTGSDRLSTRATSAQVHLEINMGLFQTFQKEGRPFANVYCNDIDQDVLLAGWQLQNYERILNHSEPLINKLVYMDEILDTTGGAYPFPLDSEMRRTMNWIFEPYLTKRYSGTLRSATSADLLAIYESVSTRITAYSLGKGETLDLSGTSELLYSYPRFSIIKETGPKARSISYSNHNAFIVHLGTRNGYHDYTIAKRSPWVSFPIEEIYEFLNAGEMVYKNSESTDKWGGSNIIGGSPRNRGTNLDPESLGTMINDYLTLTKK